MKNRILYMIIIGILLQTGLLFSQSLYFGMSQPDVSKFPYVSSSFTAVQASGTYFDNITNNDFLIKENGKIIPASDITVDCVYDAPVDYLLVIDNSASMNEKIEGQRKMDWVILGANYFIDNLAMDGKSSIAISSFNASPKIRCNFTADKQALKDSLAKIGVVAAPTDFNNAFLEKPDGALELIKQAPIDKRRVVIFLTDGRHTETRGKFKALEIIDELKNNNINCFTITFLDTNKNEDLSAIAAMSGGTYEFVSSASRLDNVLSEIGTSTRSKPVCLVTWKSALSCDPVELFRNLDVTFKRIQGQPISFQYKAPQWSIFRIQTDQQTYDFGNPASGDSVDRTITLTPNLDVDITDFLVMPSTYFRILDYGNGTYTKPSGSVIIKAGQTRTLKVRFTQGTPQQPRFSILYLEATPCPLEIPLVGGKKQIVITNPKQGDVISACSTIDINWTGIDSTEKVKLYYTTDNGSQWFKIVDDVEGGTYKWTPPVANAKYKIRGVVTYAQTYKWAISDGGVANENVTSIDAQDNELFCVVSGIYDDTTNINGNDFLNKGGIDMFVAKYDADGKMRWIRSAGSKNQDNASGACIDPVGNVFLTGETYNDVQFESQTFGLARLYSPHLFLAKYSTFGNFLKCTFIEPDNGAEYFESQGLFIKYSFDGVNEPHIIIKGSYKGSYFNSDLGKYLNKAINWTPFTCEFNPSLELIDIYNGNPTPNSGFSSLKKSYPTGTIFEAGDFTDTKNVGGFDLSSNGGSDYWLSKQSVDARNEYTTEEFEVVIPQLELLWNFMGSDSIGYHNDSSYIDLGSEFINDVKTVILDSILTNNVKLPAMVVGYKLTGQDTTSFGIDKSYLNLPINQGDTVNFGVTFNPLKKGLCKATLELIGNCGTSVFVNLYGKGLCHSEAIDTIRFASMLVGEPTTKTISATFYNPMVIPIKIRPMIESDVNHNQHWRDFKLLVPDPGIQITVNPFTEVEFSIKFTPSALGERQAFINYNIDAGCEVLNTVLVGYGLTGTITTNSINWGKERLKYNFPNQNLVIRNIGNSIKTVTEIQYTDLTMQNTFQLTAKQYPFDIAGKDSALIPITFNPQNEIYYSTNLKIITSEADTSVSLLEGETYLPMMKTDKACDSDVKIGSSGIAYIDLTNPSTSSALNINSINLSNNNEFAFQLGSISNVILLKGETKRFLIDYTPQVAMSHKTDVLIEADDYDGLFTNAWKTTTVPIICDALKFDHVDPVFGPTLLCGDNIKFLSLTNTSESTDADVFLGQSIISGQDPTAFEIMNKSPQITVGGGQTVKIPIQFTPTEPKKYSALLTIPGSNEISFDIPLAGEGREIIPSTDLKTSNLLPSDIQTLTFIADMPILEKGIVDSLEFVIRASNNAIYINPNTFKSLNPNITWAPVKLNTQGDIIVKGKGPLNVPFKNDLFTFKYTGMLDDSTQTTVSYKVIYPCNERNFDVRLVKIDKVCMQQTRNIIVADYNYTIAKPSPNPVGNEFNLDFTIALSSFTQIDIYNMLGKKVKTLFADDLKAGSYEMKFPATDLPSGSYIIKFQSGRFAKAMSLQIIK